MARTVIMATLVLAALTASASARGEARGQRAARLSSIWDFLLPPRRSSGARDRSDVRTNEINTSSKSGPQAPQKKMSNIESRTPATTTTYRPRLPVVTSEDGKRKIVLSLMDVYSCPDRGVFPIDGDCARFLMCRRYKDQDRIKGRVFRCPKGYLFSASGARCQPEDSVACHRSQPLASLVQRATARGDLLLLP